MLTTEMQALCSTFALSLALMIGCRPDEHSRTVSPPHSAPSMPDKAAPVDRALMDATIAFLVVPEAVNVIWESYDDEPRAIVLAYDVPEAYPMPSYTAKVDALLRNRGMERLHEDPKMPNHYTAAQSGWVRVAHGYVWSDWWQMPRGELIRVLIACVTDGSIPQASNVGSVTISWYSGETAAEWMRKGATSRTAGNGSDAGRRRLPASQVGTNGTVR